MNSDNRSYLASTKVYTLLSLPITLPIIAPAEARCGAIENLGDRMATIQKPPLAKIFFYQQVVIAVTAFTLLPLGSDWFVAVWLGGLVQSLPQAWFNYQAYRFVGASRVHEMLRAMYWGQSGKLILTAALFAVVLSLFKPDRVFALFGMFSVMIPVNALIAGRLMKARA